MPPVALPIGEALTSPPVDPPPPLRDGDRMTRDEFERRYDAMPDGVKAELIDEVVYMHPPVPFAGHGRSHFKVSALLGVYEETTPGVFGFDNASVRLDLGSMPQPDLGLLIDPALGGTARVDADDVVSGSPELVVEVAASIVAYDSRQKLEAYRRNGVGEYVLWRTLDRQIDHFALTADGRFQRVASPDGVARSGRFPGLWLDTTALIAFDSTAAFATLRRGLATPDHAAFAADLARRRAAATGRPRP